MNILLTFVFLASFCWADVVTVYNDIASFDAATMDCVPQESDGAAVGGFDQYVGPPVDSWVVKQSHGVPVTGLVEQFEKGSIVSVFMKDGVSAVATIQDVVANTAGGDSCCTPHPERISESAQTARK